MPVDRQWIDGYAVDRPDLYQALTSLADASDAMESAAGLSLGTQAQQAPVPAAPSQFAVTAANGHFVLTVSPPAPPPMVQYEAQSAVDQNWGSGSQISDFLLGFGQGSLDVVDPGATKFWRLRWRAAGSAWSKWLTYSNSQGVVALSSGNLVTT